MPSSITHAYIAKNVYEILDKKIKKRFSKYDLENYKTYAQGPDILYFYNIIFPINKKSREIIKLGHYMHNNQVNQLFINLTEKVKQSKNFSEFLFLIGLTTHYITDSKIHPYINYKATINLKNEKKRRDNHFMIETYIDNYMINKNEKVNYKKFKVHEFCFNLKRDEKVANLLNKTFKDVFDKDDIGIYYFKGLKDMKNFFRFLRYDPTSLKKYCYKILNPVAKICFRDVRYLSYNFALDNDEWILNLNHEIWWNRDKKDLKSTKSFLDLYDEVVINCKNIILILYEYVFEEKQIDLEKLFGNKSYANGLKLK